MRNLIEEENKFNSSLVSDQAADIRKLFICLASNLKNGAEIKFSKGDFNIQRKFNVELNNPKMIFRKNSTMSYYNKTKGNESDQLKILFILDSMLKEVFENNFTIKDYHVQFNENNDSSMSITYTTI